MLCVCVIIKVTNLGLPNEVVERLVKRPEDLPKHVVQNIKNYKHNLLRILEDYMADHDQQYLIELDANKNINILFQVGIVLCR